MVDRELDLVKVIRRLKMLVLSTLGTLTLEQRQLVTKASELVVVTSGDGSNSSSGSHSETHLEGRGEQLNRAISRLQCASQDGSNQGS